jgi:hypothetical protein
MSMRPGSRHHLILTCILVAAGCRDYPVQGHPELTASRRFTAFGFTCYDSQDSLWVFRTGSSGHRAFRAQGPSAAVFTAEGIGPGGRQIRSNDRDTAIEYLGSRPGFTVRMRNGDLWVWRIHSTMEEDILAGRIDEKCFAALQAGPLGVTVKADTTNVYLAWAATRPGFFARVVNNNVWIAPANSDAADALADGKVNPDKCATLIGGGPGGRHLLAADQGYLSAWTLAVDGFAAYLDRQDRQKVWVFIPDSPAHRAFQEQGAPARHADGVSGAPGGRVVFSDNPEVARQFVVSLNH